MSVVSQMPLFPACEERAVRNKCWGPPRWLDRQVAESSGPAEESPGTKSPRRTGREAGILWGRKGRGMCQVSSYVLCGLSLVLLLLAPRFYRRGN